MGYNNKSGTHDLADEQDTPDAPTTTTTSWWLTDFDSGLRKFNLGAKVMGDQGLPPAIRALLLENEECQHRDQSGMPPRRSR